MPRRVKVVAVLGGAGWAALTVLLAWAGARVHWALSGFFVAASLAAMLMFLFIHIPRFDPSGCTLWRGNRKGRRLALTFDDGPSPCTPAILEALATKGIKATFFVLGENAKRFPDLVSRARQAGHAIGNHGSSHRKMHRLSRLEIEREITEAEAVLGSIATVSGKKLLRVPHGVKSLRLVEIVRRMGYMLIAWTAGVWDSDRPGTQLIVSRALKAVQPGCVLLLHDGDGTRPDADRAQTAEALPKIIETCLNDGYEFVTIPQLFAESEP